VDEWPFSQIEGDSILSTGFKDEDDMSPEQATAQVEESEAPLVARLPVPAMVNDDGQ
jgi:hypothetical protein